MLSRLFAVAAILTPALAAAPPAAAIPDGGYIGLGLGGAVVSGDRGVIVTPDGGWSFNTGVVSDTPIYEELVRTDAGGGVALNLRFGWLIEGIIAPELDVSGHGTLDFDDGAGYVSFLLRFHPAQLFVDHEDRAWDFDVYVGAGYAIMGYHPDEELTFRDDGLGWEGWALHTGLGFFYQVGDAVSLGVDLRVALPQYASFIEDWDDDRTASPDGTPSTLILMPTAQVRFHL